MRRVFLDTGYLIALEASDDQHHSQAIEHWQDILKQKPKLITTSYVFDEVVTFFNSRGHQGWAYFQQRADKRYSLTDCISFATMRREAIEEALSFDNHFEQAGFVRLPAMTSGT